MTILGSTLVIGYGLVTYAVMLVLLRVWGEAAPYYSWWYSMGWAVGFIPFFVVLFLFARLVRKSERTELDRLRPVLIQSLFTSFLYALNYLGVSTSNPHVEGPVQVVLAQIPLLFSVAFSVIIFRRVYAVMAWVGAFLVLAGVLATSLLPAITASSDSSGTSIGWSLVYIMGMVPLGLLPICFEGFQKAKGSDGKVNTLELRLVWTNVLLVGWLILLLPAFMAFKEPPFGEFVDNSENFFECILTGTDGYDGDDCGTASWVFWLTLLVAAMQSHSQVLISRSETGAFATLVLTLSPFLADLIYPIAPLMGQYTEALSIWDAVGAVFCVIGVLLFAYSDHTSQKAMEDALTMDKEESSVQAEEEGVALLQPARKKLYLCGWQYLPLVVGTYRPVEDSKIIRAFMPTAAPRWWPSSLTFIFE